MWSQTALHIKLKTDKGSGSYWLLTPVLLLAGAAPPLTSVQTYSSLIIRTRRCKSQLWQDLFREIHKAVHMPSLLKGIKC